jgi:hypothetical protein
LNLNITCPPIDAGHLGLELHACFQATGNRPHEWLIAALEAKLAVTVDLFVGDVALNQRMHADAPWISGMEAFYEPQPLLLYVPGGIGLLEEILKRLVSAGFNDVHALEQTIYFGEDVRPVNPSPVSPLQDFPLQLCQWQSMFSGKLENFRWTSVNKFCSQFDRIAIRVLREDASTKAFSCFQQEHLPPGIAKSTSRSQPGNATSDYDDIKLTHGTALSRWRLFFLF